MNKTLLLLLSIFNYSFCHVDQVALLNFEKKCMICHDTYNKNDLAPPVVAINQIYTKKTKGNLPQAKKMIVSFLSNPSDKKALMKPAIKIFGLMPKQLITKKEIEDFADVILETDFEIPDWFDKHFKSHKLNLDHNDMHKKNEPL